jgi:hypothetical protein
LAAAIFLKGMAEAVGLMMGHTIQECIAAVEYLTALHNIYIYCFMNKMVHLVLNHNRVGIFCDLIVVHVNDEIELM